MDDTGPKRSIGMISLALGAIGLCVGLMMLIQYAENLRDKKEAFGLYDEPRGASRSHPAPTPQPATPTPEKPVNPDPFADRKKDLTPLQYHVTQESGTERPYTNEFDHHFEPGIYVDIVSGKPLFTSLDKFNSGCGWPAFSKPADGSEVLEHQDTTQGMERTEVRSKTADSHLGHVFNDGPASSGGLRYCINSASLRFVPVAELEKQGYGEYLKLFAPKAAESP